MSEMMGSLTTLSERVDNVEEFALDRRSTTAYKQMLIKTVSKLRLEGVTNRYVVSKLVDSKLEKYHIWYIDSEEDADQQEKAQIGEIKAAKDHGGKGMGKGKGKGVFHYPVAQRTVPYYGKAYMRTIKNRKNKHPTNMLG